jgi:hypothetical protein
MTSGDVARPPVAAAAAMTPSNQQTTMTQHYGARSQRQLLPSGWMELTDAASNSRCYFHKTTCRMVFSKAEMLLKSPPVTPSPTPRMSSPATVGSLAPEPDQAGVSAPFPPTIMEATNGTREEPLELSSSSSVSSSASTEFSMSQTQTMRQTTSISRMTTILKPPHTNLQNDKDEERLRIACMHSKKTKKKD